VITQDNLSGLLTTLGFSKHAQRYARTIGAATLEIEFAKQVIVYPEAQGLPLIWCGSCPTPGKCCRYF
jgi:hypothetical protein